MPKPPDDLNDWSKSHLIRELRRRRDAGENARRFRLWACCGGHVFQARDDEDPDVWRPVCKRCAPEKPGVPRPFMDLIEVEQCP